MRSFMRLIESQIAKARAAGGLTGLKGEGKPLPERPVETGEQAVASAGMRIMAEAGVVPEEFQIKKELDAARKIYASLSTEEERAKQMSKISSLELRYNIAVEARRKFMR
ncbi:DnaJ-like protein, subfamily C, member 28 domain-containing protein [Sulfitobacter donghicola DSW-25 = KCTC 12864 = JCM 14565]|uniref:Molecular chaperone DnaJ n=2 Tax=Sulfitobacter TaxID=60136 RepID=A0A073IFT3_9RHOB|nr:DnaJ family domain-containing protein [Sulfitobacter donghicola]KEJ89208.1 molecular chaperone DnaJ [Sulfitobacter donghicola DSW-25 = KCTC 12864 = JCM 14565]KIN68998.1 DnaJ-like protein, subfamily C, member 28 domain-containing protein [Sulfitobacter donghicola DSW-25 = KCTC 12864 = JCM 14565]